VTKTRKGRGTKYQGREQNEEVGFKCEERRSEKSDLGVKGGRDIEKREKRGDSRMIIEDGKNRQCMKDESFSNQRSATHHPNKLSPLIKLIR